MPQTDHSTAKHAPRSACAGGGSGCPQPCAGGDRDCECQWSVGLTLSSAGRTFVLYKTRSLGYLAEPLDISAEQGYLNPRVGYLGR